MGIINLSNIDINKEPQTFWIVRESILLLVLLLISLLFFYEYIVILGIRKTDDYLT
jgi:hypothetical protein